MRIGIASDIHLENMSPARQEAVSHRLADAFSGCDLVLLAGDIHQGLAAVRWSGETFSQPVCLVPGNHEFWYGEIEDTRSAMADLAKKAFPHVHFLDNLTKELSFGGERVRVIGTTLWTDMELFGDPTLGMLSARVINDFKKISGDRRRPRALDHSCRCQNHAPCCPPFPGGRTGEGF